MFLSRTIHSVIPQFDMRAGVTGPQNIRPFVRISSTDYNAPVDVQPNQTTLQGLVGYAWVEDPATTAAWTAAAIAALDIGFEVKA